MEYPVRVAWQLDRGIDFEDSWSWWRSMVPLHVTYGKRRRACIHHLHVVLNSRVRIVYSKIFFFIYRI